MDGKSRPISDPPAEIEINYNTAGNGAHVFTATGVPGFYYRGSTLEDTFNDLAVALSLHISRLFNKPANYRLAMGLEDFKRCIEPSFDEEEADISELILKNSIIARKSPLLVMARVPG